MASTLQRGAAGPIYQQLQNVLRERIAAGVWQPGQAIPSEQALVQQFGIARMTVRQALDGLIREGLLVRRRGSGTFLAHGRVERELTRMHGFSEDMRARGMVPSARLLAREVIPAPKTVSAMLQLGWREAVIYVRRLRLADAQPMALETSYLHYDLCRTVLDADLESGSLYTFLQEMVGIQLCFASQELEAALPSPSEAAALEITRRRPVLVIRQTTYVQAGGQEVPGIYGTPCTVPTGIAFACKCRANQQRLCRLHLHWASDCGVGGHRYCHVNVGDTCDVGRLTLSSSERDAVEPLRGAKTAHDWRTIRARMF